MTTLGIIYIIQNSWVATDNFLTSCEPTIRKRRETISPKPNVRLNLWTFMKNSIGKDLSRIPLPVSVCVCACACVCVSVSVSVSVYLHMCVCVCLSLCVCACVCVNTRICNYVCICICVCVSVCMCLYECIVYVYV